MKTSYTSLDRFTSGEYEFDRPDRFRRLVETVQRDGIVARGAGVSYVAASFSPKAVSIETAAFDRILAFDPDRSWIEVEAGVSLGKLFEFLTPRGFHIPIQPGHPQVTIGGCVAANVHGKNQYSDGIFGSLVQELTLYHPDHGVVRASPTENAEIFDLTVGGYGLTGIILSVRIGIAKLAGAAVRQRNFRVDGLLAAFREVDRLKQDHDLIYCWNDLSRLGRNRGAGVVVTGSYVAGDSGGKAETNYKRLDPSAKKRLRPNVFTDKAMPWVNRIYAHQNRPASKPVDVPLFQFNFPAVGKEFFFDFFGDTGFVELQLLLPSDAVEAYVEDFLSLQESHGRPIALTTIKAVRGDQRLLHFNGNGFNFTIELRNSPQNIAFLNNLDDLNCRYGGITNIIKDSRLRPEIAERQYPEIDLFRQRLRTYDPRRRFSSALSERLLL
ncbi:MAG: FAD-binding oxidoreductase [Pseudomonadota bacterium]|nr:hypothetical protein [Rhodospirillaceae bacterium]MEE2721242.1 FAD-binding oxidoreductase [Pseudomonadota bacterium]